MESKHISRRNNFNNIGFAAMSIGFVVDNIGTLSVSKAMLIMPLVSNKDLLSYLSKDSARIRGFESLLIERFASFANFNSRYYDNLCVSIDAIQLLKELDIISIGNSSLEKKFAISYDKTMGNRLGRVFKAVNNICEILKEREVLLYQSLRIQL